MMRRFPMSVRLSLLLLAFAAATASAQRSTAPADTVAIAQTDSVRPSGGNWLVALLKKIARRSDDSVATSDGDVDNASESASLAVTTRRVFTSRRDSLAYESARTTADRATGYRVVVDIFAHQLYVIDGGDTLYAAPVATAMNATLTYGKKSWRFETPRGVRKVLSKDKDPIWTPPEWNYAEVALEHQLKLR